MEARHFPKRFWGIQPKPLWIGQHAKILTNYWVISVLYKSFDKQNMLSSFLFLSESLIDGLIVLSNTWWIPLPLYLETCCRIDFTKGPNVSGKSTKRCKSNIPQTIFTSIVPGPQELMWCPSSTSNMDFGVLCIFHQDNTVIGGQDSTDTAALPPYPLWLVRYQKRCFQKELFSCYLMRLKR